MADIVLYVLISMIGLISLVGIIYQIALQRKKKTEVDIYTQQLQFAVDQTTREMQKFFDILRLKPTAKGELGENIVSMVLANLPRQYVRKQYQPRDVIGCKIDFVVQLPDSNLFIPIDSKFVFPSYFSEKLDITKDPQAQTRLNKEILRRAKEITKYTKSAETTDFVLMFLPDLVHSYLNPESFQELAAMNVVPTNTSGLLSAIFMIKMQYRFVNLNKSVKRFSMVQMNVCQGLRDAAEKLTTSSKQLQHSLNNLIDATKEVSELGRILETLGEEENADMPFDALNRI
ncbi:MAG: DNA recombination protein RmuC [Candidatus Heimdallarchaeota archaeon]|nr:DNA recombination protein RmuC [Candidatus Heimdallarchaeota archaeon]